MPDDEKDITRPDFSNDFSAASNHADQKLEELSNAVDMLAVSAVNAVTRRLSGLFESAHSGESADDLSDAELEELAQEIEQDSTSVAGKLAMIIDQAGDIARRDFTNPSIMQTNIIKMLSDEPAAQIGGRHFSTLPFSTQQLLADAFRSLGSNMHGSYMGENQPMTVADLEHILNKSGIVEPSDITPRKAAELYVFLGNAARSSSPTSGIGRVFVHPETTIEPQELSTVISYAGNGSERLVQRIEAEINKALSDSSEVAATTTPSLPGMGNPV